MYKRVYRIKTRPHLGFQHTFFNPDYTVGFGISPNPALARPRTITADRELHPALKTLLLFNCLLHYNMRPIYKQAHFYVSTTFMSL